MAATLDPIQLQHLTATNYLDDFSPAFQLSPLPWPLEEHTLNLTIFFCFAPKKFTEQGGEFLIRPYAEKFIEILSQYYEIVIFTAA